MLHTYDSTHEEENSFHAADVLIYRCI